VAFIYSSLSGNGISRFMIVTAESFLKTGKYNVFFFTKPKTKKELSYNQKIKRIYAYDNNTMIKKAVQEEKIDFLIVNNIFASGLIIYYKSLGVKVIGIYHGVFMSAMYNNSTKSYHSWRNLELLDAFIHISVDDYYYYNNFGFKRNIFIPNLYTFEPSKTPSSKLSNHNIMMLGRLSDKKKGLIYALKAMHLIIKEIPDAKLYLVSSDGKTQQLIDTMEQYIITNNVIFVPFTPNVEKYFLDSSVFFFTSLTEAFPMALNEAKAYGLPCVTFDVSYSLPYQSGVIKVEHFDYQGLAREVVKLLKDYNYRIKMGMEAKLSLNKFTNEGTTDLWGRLFNSLKSGENEYQKLRKEIMNKYYNEEIAEKHMEKQFEYLKMYNKFFRCHSIQNFTNLSYVNNIQTCQNVSRRY
jgi:glycosyltransferase involved in cell wall biosynthesis